MKPQENPVFCIHKYSAEQIQFVFHSGVVEMNLDFVPALKFSWAAAPDGRIVQDCVIWRKLTGQTRDEAKDFGWLQALHLEDRDRTANNWAACVAEVKAFEATFRIRRYDETYCWLEGKALPILDDHGVVTGWSGLSRDLSFVVPKTISGQGSNALYRAIAANFPMGAVFVVDTDFRYQLVDGPGLQDVGMFPSDFEGKTLWEVLPPDLAAQHEINYRAVLAGQSFRQEHEVKNQVYLSHGVPLRDEYGAVHLALVVSYNITERKQAEKRLHLFERISHVTRSANNADAMMAETAKLLGEHLHVTGCAYAEVVPEENQLRVRQVWTCEGIAFTEAGQALDSLHPWIARLRHTEATRVIFNVENENGNDFTIEGASTPPVKALIWSPLVRQGVLVAVLLVFQDAPRDWSEDEAALLKEVLERAWVHVERARMAETLHQADQNKNEFLATLAHELRNPLASLSTGLTLLKVPSADATVAHVVIRMQRQLDTMTRLVDDLLDVSRISQGKIEVRPQKTVVQYAINDAIDAIRPLIKMKNQALETRLATHPVYIYADPTRMIQIISNVLNNAAKYTPPDGLIEITTAITGNSIFIKIKDSGAGIPQAMLSKIFNKFTQVASTRVYSQGGLGVGLALTKELVELHHGTIKAESAGPGLGSTFTIQLPLMDEVERAPSQ